MSYATPADLKLRYDARRLGDLVKDDNTRATAGDLDSNLNVQAALDDAQGMVDAAVLAGARYSTVDLAALTGTNKAFLLRINCDLAYGFLILRRGFTDSEMSKLAPGYAQAVKTLELLRTGERVFDIEANIEAGTLDKVVLSKNITLVSAASRLFGDLDIQGKL